MLFQILGFALLLPFFGWAIYLLRRRFVYYEENSMVLEAGTAAGVLLFFWVETTVLKYALGQQQVLLYLFAVLGLVVAGFALYAHVIISLASRILVDMVIPGDAVAVNQPRFGPVESLERMEDFDGALREYLVLARIYPRNFEVLKRTGRIHEVLDQYDEAITWYERARDRAGSDQEALTAVNRMCAIYDTELETPDEADRQLAWFVDAYPDSLDRDTVRDRLERRAIRQDRTESNQLESMEELPVVDGEPAHSSQRRSEVASERTSSLSIDQRKTTSALVALESEGVSGSAPTASKSTPASAGKKSGTLVLENAEAPPKTDKPRPSKPSREKVSPKKSRKHTKGTEKKGLEALSNVTPDETSKAPPTPTPKSKMSLDAMDKEN